MFWEDLEGAGGEGGGRGDRGKKKKLDYKCITKAKKKKKEKWAKNTNRSFTNDYKWPKKKRTKMFNLYKSNTTTN